MNKFNYIIIIVLVFVIFLQRNCNSPKTMDKTIVKIDTIWKVKKDTILKTVKVFNQKVVSVKDTVYSPGNNIITCTDNYNKLLNKYTIQTIYLDTINLDSLGTIVIKDTVYLNKLYGKRQYFRNYRIPIITKTVITNNKQLYIGGNIFANKESFINFSPGILYKDKKDKIFQANVGMDVNGKLNFGVGTYWKIKF